MVSFLLVIYYNRYVVLKLRNLVFLFNRLGDVFFLIILFSYFNYSKINLLINFNIRLRIIFLFRFLLKSSQFPLRL